MASILSDDSHSSVASFLGVMWGSTLKQAIRRVRPGFSEGYYGYGSFSDLLEDLKAKGLIQLEYDESRGNYKVRRTKT